VLYTVIQKKKANILGEESVLMLVKYERFPYLSRGLAEYKHRCPPQFVSDF